MRILYNFATGKAQRWKYIKENPINKNLKQIKHTSS